MGAYMSKPNTEKVYDHGANQWISYSSCSMQGWRMHQEDAHNCIPDFDGSRGISFFAVYDGHGGIGSGTTADVDDVDEEEDESYSELLALRAEANQPLEHVLEQYGGEDALPMTIKVRPNS
ncbi:putative protein phosphatase [Schistosoma japonicum]|uniref:PPM-type phosphatase domain-containing protein n=1 Tax=Schistosoma japonicum TaxID=6182 RepID=A0A4Z2DGL3_SCHJA|nr:putative protein phosphatase [Schistosoma japonicum]